MEWFVRNSLRKIAQQLKAETCIYKAFIDNLGVDPGTPLDDQWQVFLRSLNAFIREGRPCIDLYLFVSGILSYCSSSSAPIKGFSKARIKAALTKIYVPKEEYVLLGKDGEKLFHAISDREWQDPKTDKRYEPLMRACSVGRVRPCDLAGLPFAQSPQAFPVDANKVKKPTVNMELRYRLKAPAADRPAGNVVKMRSRSFRGRKQILGIAAVIMLLPAWAGETGVIPLQHDAGIPGWIIGLIVALAAVVFVETWFMVSLFVAGTRKRQFDEALSKESSKGPSEGPSSYLPMISIDDWQEKSRLGKLNVNLYSAAGRDDQAAKTLSKSAMQLSSFIVWDVLSAAQKENVLQAVVWLAETVHSRPYLIDMIPNELSDLLFNVEIMVGLEEYNKACGYTVWDEAIAKGKEACVALKSSKNCFLKPPLLV